MRPLILGSSLAVLALGCARGAGSSESAPPEEAPRAATSHLGMGVVGAPAPAKRRNWWSRGNKACPGKARLVGAAYPAGKRIACELADGTRHGRVTTWWPNGNKKRFETYRRGKLHGPVMGWRENGTLVQRALYRRGLRHGPFTEWHGNGKRARQGRYRGGKRVGHWRSWDQRGALLGKAPERVADKWWTRKQPCPKGSALTGRAGVEIQCKAGKTRHGGRATWNRFGHLATLESWDQGEQVSKKDFRPWRFVVLSDIHIFPSGRIPKFAKPVIEFVKKMKPRAVLITGDSTNGNKGDRYGAKRIALWWQRLHELLDPLYKAGIPVLPMAGNHDTYRKEHREGYANAWNDIAKRVSPLKINVGGNPPWYYSIDVDGTHLTMLNLVTQRIDRDQQAWLRKDLAAARKSGLRLAFGHAPISSVIARPIMGYRKHMMELFGSANVHAYICGHEHVLWDETLVVDNHKVRQVISGTASGTYHFGIRGPVKRKWCQNRTCRFPDNGYGFRIKSTREQVLRASFVAVDVIRDNTAIEVHPYSLGADGKVALFPRAPSPATLRR